MQFRTSASVPGVVGFTLNNVGLRPEPPTSEPSSELSPEAVDPVPVVASDQHPCGQTIMPAVSAPLGRDAIVRRQRYWSHVAAAECRHGLPAGLLDAVVLQESRYHPAALSPAGALGLAQLMPATARGLGVADRLDPLANVDGGARYLRAMLEKFGSVPLALAAYNAGPGRVVSARGIPANRETPGYVRNVLSFWSAMSADPQRSLRSTAELLGFATTEASSQTAR